MPSPKQPATQQAQADRPTFREPPRYKLLEKAFLGEVKIKEGEDWMPYTDVLLDPEEQPIIGLSGPFGGRGTPKRQPILIEFAGIPDSHMEPINEAGNWMLDHVEELIAEAQKAGIKARGQRGRRNPIDALTIVGPGSEVLNPVRESV